MKLSPPNIFHKENIIYLLILIIFIITLYPLTKIGFTVGDDMDTFIYSYSIKKQFNLGIEYALSQGRFYNIFTRWIYSIPYLVDSKIYFQLTYILPFALCFLLFICLMQRLYKNLTLTLLSSIIIASNFQILGFHSSTTSYPFFFSFSLCLIITSFHLLISYYDSNKKYLLVISSIVLFISCLFYEAYLVYYLIPLLIIISKERENSKFDRKKIYGIIRKYLPYFIGAILYISIYLIFRICNPTEYYGNRIVTNIKLFGVLQSATELGYYSLPLVDFCLNKELLNYQSLSLDSSFNLFQIDGVFILQGLLIIFIFIYSIRKYKKIKNRSLLKLFFLGIILYYIPLLPLAVTSKYYLNNVYSYVPTFFSFSGVILSLSSIILLGLNLANKNKYIRIIYVSIISISIFIVSVFTQTINKAIAEDLHISSYRLDMVKNVFTKDILRNYPICLEQMHNTSSTSGKWVTLQKFTWRNYIKRVSNKDVNAFDKYSILYNKYKGVDTNLYIGFFSQSIKTKDALMFFAQVNGKNLTQKQEDLISDRIIILYHSPFKTFNISLASKKNDSIYVDDNLIYSFGNFHSANISTVALKNRNISIFEIKGKSIVASTITISNILNNNKIIHISCLPKTKELILEETIYSIKTDPSWMTHIREKAKKNKISIEKQILYDAQWSIEQKNRTKNENK